MTNPNTNPLAGAVSPTPSTFDAEAILAIAERIVSGETKIAPSIVDGDREAFRLLCAQVESLAGYEKEAIESHEEAIGAMAHAQHTPEVKAAIAMAKLDRVRGVAEGAEKIRNSTAQELASAVRADGAAQRPAAAKREAKRLVRAIIGY